MLVGQLRDHLAAGWRLAGYQGPADKTSDVFLAALTHEHRLQPFSPDYFPGDPTASPWFTYSREWRTTATEPSDLASDSPAPGDARCHPQGTKHPLDESPSATVATDRLPALVREEPLGIRDLADFLKAPVKTFFRQRLGVYFECEDRPGEDQEPFALDGSGAGNCRTS